MFDDPAPRRSRVPWIVLVVGLLVVGALALGGGLLGRLDVLLAGGNPLASPVAASRVDQPYDESPLRVALRLEDELGDVETDSVLRFADELATELGTWLLATTGASDVQVAEGALWADGDPDDLAVRWAIALQDRQVVSRRNARLADGVDRQPLVVHPDDLVLLWAHVAWRLDLRSELVRSPVHHYALWREPGGERVRGVEPTCFRRVDALGRLVPSEEPSVGRRLTFPEDHYPSGAGGIPNPVPLAPGTYEAVSATALEGDLRARLAARTGDIDTLRAGLDAGPAAVQALWDRIVADGVAAWERGDAAALAASAEAARALHQERAEVLPAAPDHLALIAASANRASVLGPLFAHYEPTGPVEVPGSPAHAVAMWVDLESKPVRHVQWNARIIPLMNHHRQDPGRFATLCGYGEQALRGVEETLDELMPSCSTGG